MTVDLQSILASLGTAVVAVWGFVRFIPATYADRLFGHYLERRLTEIKNDQSREIERLKADLNHIADRGVRSNQREYDALTAAWEHFNDAFYETRLCVASFMQFPDLTRMSEEAAKEFLDTTALRDSEKRAVLTSENRTSTYGRVIEFEQLNAAGRAIWQARSTVRRQSVFIPAALNDQFEAAVARLQRVHSERSVEIRMEKPLPNGTAEQLIGDEGDKLILELRNAVRSRLLREVGPPKNP